MRSGLYSKNTSTHLFSLVLEAGSWRSGCRRGLGLSEPLRACLGRVGEWFWAEGRQLRAGEVEKADALVSLFKALILTQPTHTRSSTRNPLPKAHLPVHAGGVKASTWEPWRGTSGVCDACRFSCLCHFN